MLFTDKELIEIRTSCQNELSKLMSLPFDDEETDAIKETLMDIIGKINMAGTQDEEDDDEDDYPEYFNFTDL